MLPDIQPGNTKILYFFNCLLDGMHTMQDKRGKRKSPEEMTEVEKLRAEVRLLRAEKRRAEIEISFLKKLEEIERRGG